MAINPVLTQVESILVVTDTVVFGYGAGQTVPPRTVICNPTADMTLTFPRVTPTIPALGQVGVSTNIIPGVGTGYLLTVLNITNHTVTLDVDSSDSAVYFPGNLAVGQSMTASSLYPGTGEGDGPEWIRVDQGLVAGISSQVSLVDVTAPVTATQNAGVMLVTAGTSTLTLPAPTSDGSVLKIVGMSPDGGFTITPIGRASLNNTTFALAGGAVTPYVFTTANTTVAMNQSGWLTLVGYTGTWIPIDSMGVGAAS